MNLYLEQLTFIMTTLQFYAYLLCEFYKFNILSIPIEATQHLH
jgi:hypothetical protein